MPDTQRPPVPLTLADPWPGRVRGGLPVVDVVELPGLAELQPPLGVGDALVLLDPEGVRLGYGLFDPENGVVRVLPSTPVEELNVDFFVRRLHRAFDLRQAAGLTGEHAAFRLINSEGDGLSGFIVDVYAGHVVV
ncbi:MAG: hypothetical protein ACRDD1_04320, partial [Planctomycetia bacterium]